MFIRIFTFLVCFAVTIPAFSASKEALEPFLGKWEIDKNKTSSPFQPEDMRVEIDRDGDSGLVIKSKYKEPKTNVYPLMWVGVLTQELPLSVDGSEKVNHIGPFTHVSKTTLSGNTMTTDFTAALQKEGSVEGKVDGQWIRKVSDDGKEMTLQVITKASDGRNMDQTLVFKRD
jgi:hypothetical protein